MYLQETVDRYKLSLDDPFCDSFEPLRATMSSTIDLLLDPVRFRLVWQEKGVIEMLH
jgi:hypothetical protein